MADAFAKTDVVDALKAVVLEEPGKEVEAPSGADTTPEGLPECPEPEIGTTEGPLKKLIARMTKRRTLPPGIQISVTAARSWWVERSLERWIAGSQPFTRYPDLPFYGISQSGFNIPLNAAPTQVDPVVIYDGDARWGVSENSHLARRKLKLNSALADALGRGENMVQAFGGIARMRGITFEGTVALTLAERYAGEAIERGSSFLPMLLRLFGYMTSFHLPADSGGMVAGSIPADAGLVFGDRLQPSSPASIPIMAQVGPPPVAGAGDVRAWYISAQTYLKWFTGSIEIPDHTRDSLGDTLLIIPIPKTGIRLAATNAWNVIVHMWYPLRDIKRYGRVRSRDGNLTRTQGGMQVPFNCYWWPGSTMYFVPGPRVGPPYDGVAWCDLVVVFVLTEDYPTGVTGETMQIGPEAAVLDIPMVDNMTNANAVNILPALVGMFNNNIRSHSHSLQQLQRRVFSMGAASELHDCMLMLQGLTTFKRWGGEARSSAHRATFWGPDGAVQRGWVEAGELLPFSNVNRTLMQILPANGWGQWPNARGDPATMVYAVNYGTIHWEVPYLDLEFTMALALGILVPEAGSELAQKPVGPTDLIPWVMDGGAACVAAIDCVLMSSGASRNLLWYDEANPHWDSTPSEVEGLVQAHDAFWGRPGRVPDPEVTSMSCLIAREWFGERAIPWFPNNGQVFDTRLAPNAPPGAWGIGDQILGRMDPVTLGWWAADAVSTSATQDRDFSGFDWKPVIRTALRDRRDFGLKLPDALEGPTGQGWKLVVEMDGMGGGGRDINVWNSFHVAAVDNTPNRWTLALNEWSPMTWGSLLSVDPWAAVVQDLYLDPTDRGISGGRPLNDVSQLQQQELLLITTDRGLVYTGPQRSTAKAAYFQELSTSKWDPLYPGEGKRMLRRRGART